MEDVTSLEFMSDLFRYRQSRLCQDLMAKEAAMQKKGVSPYDIAMMGTSNLIQDLAQSYGERRIIDCCIEWVNTITPAHDKRVMETVFRVFALDCVKRDLGWYVKEKAIKPQAGANLITT